MTEKVKYKIILEQQLNGRWRWKVNRGNNSYHGSRWYDLTIPGFFREYAIGTKRSEKSARKAAESFIKRHKEYEAKRLAEEIMRKQTRKVLEVE